jgi:hypothetical protein
VARSQSHSTLSCGGAPLDVIKQTSSSKLAQMTNRLSEPVAIASNQIISDGAVCLYGVTRRADLDEAACALGGG